MSFYNPDVHTGRVLTFMRGLTQSTVISAWARVEFHSALGIQVRRKDISKILATELLTLFNAHCAEGFYRQTSIGSAHFTEAERLLTPLTRKLRSADALHLAVAKLERLTLVTIDDDLADAAREEAVTVVRV